MLRVIVTVALLATLATACTVRPLGSSTVFISRCSDVVLETTDGARVTGGPGVYRLPETAGCTVVTVNDEVYSLCASNATRVNCTAYERLGAEAGPRACARDAALACAEQCCAAECCATPSIEVVGTWVDHAFAGNLTGSDGIAIAPSDDRARAEDGFLVGSCAAGDGECHAECLFGEDLVLTREIYVPACEPYTLEVVVDVVSATAGTNATLGDGEPVPLRAGRNVLRGAGGPLVIRAPVPPCFDGTAFNISAIDIDSTCAAKFERPGFCPFTVRFCPFPLAAPGRPSKRASVTRQKPS